MDFSAEQALREAVATDTCAQYPRNRRAALRRFRSVDFAMSATTRIAMVFLLSITSIATIAAEEPLFQDDSHPDLVNLEAGIHSWRDGDYGDALASFRRSARYANKTAQYLIGLMYEQGQGVPADPARAYAWLDLAAERGYAEILVRREQVWKRLDAAQRRDAVAIGKTLYAEYGDAVAKPRMESALLTAYRRATGSRTGFTADLITVARACPGGSPVALARICKIGDYYAPVYWKAEQYWQAEDALWNGKVTIGPLEPAAGDAQPRD